MRQAEILRAEGRKQAFVLEAEGRKEAAFREAEARERRAQAEAVATKMVSDAIAAGDLAALNYFIAQNYTQALLEVARAPNQKVFIMPVDMASLAGTLGGIAELAKSALGESAAADAQRLPPRRAASVPPAGTAPAVGQT